MDERQEEIEDLKYHISKVAPMIEKDFAELDDEESNDLELEDIELLED